VVGHLTKTFLYTYIMGDYDQRTRITRRILERTMSLWPRRTLTPRTQTLSNQDIYITNYDGTSANTLNYYLELEVIPLDDSGAEYTTLKDMRSQ